MTASCWHHRFRKRSAPRCSAGSATPATLPYSTARERPAWDGNAAGWTGAAGEAVHRPRCLVGEVVEAADATGRLRAIIDAVRSNRVEDDFSDRWSYAREDFERKLYHKRNKVQVRFVELTDTIPVQGPETEVEGNLVVGDFLALLDKRERQVVVLLHSGYTKLGEVASVLGYKNHSPVSKYLARVQKKAVEHFGL